MVTSSTRNACKLTANTLFITMAFTNSHPSTPWLTTRRRTCPICKGDVVRPMAHPQSGDSHNQEDQSAHNHSHELDPRSDSSSAPLLIALNDDASDTEQNAGFDGQASSAPQSSWRNLASFSFSALSGDTIWHQARADRNR